MLCGDETPISRQPVSRDDNRPYKEIKADSRTLAHVPKFGGATAPCDTGNSHATYIHAYKLTSREIKCAYRTTSTRGQKC